MLALDLSWLVFILLALLLAAFWAGAQLGRRRLPQPGALGALEEAPFGLLLFHRQGRLGYANAYARRLLGLRSPNGPLPEAPWALLLEEDRQAVRQGPPRPGHYRILALPEGQKMRSLRWWVMTAGAEDAVFLFDATAQQRAEEAARTLVNDLAHELRTPLATVMTHLEVLGLSNPPEGTRQQSLALAKAEAQRMARLIQQMLELGRLETSEELERRPVNLLPLAEEAIAQVAPQAAARGVALSLRAETPLPLARAHADRLRQVFLNLLDNAIKYSRPGDHVLVSLQPQAGGVLCAIRDSGPGIPETHLPHLARRFYRAAPAGVEGNGLGLAIVEEILRLHQSRLEIESCSEGAETGTCVRFVITEAR